METNTQRVMEKAIIIPIYLRLNKPEELPYATGLRLAQRAVKSLKMLRDQDFILILPVYYDMAVQTPEQSYREMDHFLRKNFSDGRTLIFSSVHLKRARKYLAQRNGEDFCSLIDLKGYSKIRNTGLLLAQALSTEVAIFIDNDEVVEDPNYLEIACDYLNQRWNGKVVSGKGGFYVNADGSILLPPRSLWWRLLWNKTKWMNRAWEAILTSNERITPSPMLLGGNLVLHRNLFGQIPFDPYIPRGEDTDYLINASQAGFCLLFDKQLRIKHLHPERTETFYQEELRGDIERFLYEREKSKEGLTIDLAPYPGYFLNRSLYPRAAFTSVLLGLDYLLKGEWKKARECFSNINLLFQMTDDVWLRYLKFKTDWEQMMGRLPEEGLNNILDECWT